MILLLFLFGLALGAPSESPSDDDHRVQLLHGNCPMFWYNFNGRCYKYVAAHMSWADAELYCVSQGANLVSIHSQEEENFVRTLIKNFDHTEGITWIGLSDLHKEGRWMWSDGCAVRYRTIQVNSKLIWEEFFEAMEEDFRTALKRFWQTVRRPRRG
nr:galactose-specific lectin nattectin-like [Maylandia zebra]